MIQENTMKDNITEKEKQLLLQDLACRLPYQVVCLVMNGENGFDKDVLTQIHNANEVSVGYLSLPITQVRPYLRLMNTMTSRELKEYMSKQSVINLDDNLKTYADNWKSIDWLTRNMFDYRNMIGKGLALEAPPDMY